MNFLEDEIEELKKELKEHEDGIVCYISEEIDRLNEEKEETNKVLDKLINFNFRGFQGEGPLTHSVLCNYQGTKQGWCNCGIADYETLIRKYLKK